MGLSPRVGIKPGRRTNWGQSQGTPRRSPGGRSHLDRPLFFLNGVVHSDVDPGPSVHSQHGGYACRVPASEREGRGIGREVVREYARVAFGDIRRVITWSASGVVRVKPSDEPTEDDAAMIAEVQDQATANGRTLRVKLADKLHALDSLARHLGMFVEKQEVCGKDGTPLIPFAALRAALEDGGTAIVTGDEAEYVAQLKAIRDQDRERAKAPIAGLTGRAN